MRMLSFRFWIALALLAALLAGCSLVEPAGGVRGQLELVEIPAPALANNVLGDPLQQDIAVYLPPSYATANRRYPVVYYLTGLGAQLNDPVGYPLTQAAMEHQLASETAHELILVTVSGFNALGGSFYLNSPVAGNWEDFVYQDVVGYVDSHYRTLVAPASRGIAGHSMGGNGALNLAMRHPDVFGLVYALSPGLFDPQGLPESPMFRSPKVIGQVLDLMDELARLPEDQAANAFQRQYLKAGVGVRWTFAYGTAVSPAPDRKPPYIAYPYRRENDQLVRDETLWKQWDGGFGEIAARVERYQAGPLRLKAIQFEYGDRDLYAWIPRGCQHLSQQFTNAGIPHTLLTFAGDHGSLLDQRVEQYMLPFFMRELVFDDIPSAAQAP